FSCFSSAISLSRTRDPDLGRLQLLGEVPVMLPRSLKLLDVSVLCLDLPLNLCADRFGGRGDRRGSNLLPDVTERLSLPDLTLRAAGATLGDRLRAVRDQHQLGGTRLADADLGFE